MKLTLNWLKQYVDFDWSPEQLAERLTMLGLEVESRLAATEWRQRVAHSASWRGCEVSEHLQSFPSWCKL
jgi:phenylalanyl-tRNA synthetase beta chain